jgi:N-acetyl-alpha-D-muramate 1-phosphate uridylyltransferase
LENGQIFFDGEEKLTFSGISVYHPAFFDGAPQSHFPISRLLKQRMTQLQVAGEFFDGTWLDIGTPERLAALAAS